MKKSKGKKMYTTLLGEYINKRKLIREKYNWKKYPVKPNPEYAKAVEPVARKIKMYQKALNRIRAKEKILNDVAYHVKEYTHGELNVKHKKPEDNLARKLFVSYVFLLGINMPMVSKYLGSNDKNLAAGIRKKFKRENNIEWIKFKNYMKLNYKPTKLKK